VERATVGCVCVVDVISGLRGVIGKSGRGPVVFVFWWAWPCRIHFRVGLALLCLCLCGLGPVSIGFPVSL
jgi:hypothetical protein